MRKSLFLVAPTWTGTAIDGTSIASNEPKPVAQATLIIARHGFVTTFPFDQSPRDIRLAGNAP